MLELCELPQGAVKLLYFHQFLETLSSFLRVSAYAREMGQWEDLKCLREQISSLGLG